MEKNMFFWFLGTLFGGGLKRVRAGFGSILIKKRVQKVLIFDPKKHQKNT